MTTLMHVLPVGLSLLARIRENRLLAATGALDSARLIQRTGTYRPLAEVLAQATHNRELDLGHLLGQPVLDALAAAPAGLCAEWASVQAVVEQRPAPDTSVAHVLIATDTDDGLRAAALVAGRYHGRPMRYLDDPRDRPDTVEPDTVSVYRIPGLNLERQKPGPDTWEALGALGHVIARTSTDVGPDRWEVVLHLSGGYKALIPYLLVLAEGVSTVIAYRAASMAERPTLRAVATHESSDSHLVDLPVRTLSDHLYELTRSLKAALRPSGRVTGDHWDDLLGSVLEPDGSRRKLTALGTILVNVL